MLSGALSMALACGKLDEPDDAGAGADADAQTCTHGGMTYPIGAQFPMGDGCNACFCEAGGAVSCTTRGCDAPPRTTDAGIPKPPPPAPNLKVNDVVCMVTEEILAGGQPPDDRQWIHTIEATCRVLGPIRVTAMGFDDRGYPQKCGGSAVPSVSVQLLAEDGGGTYTASGNGGSCTFHSGPRDQSRLPPNIAAKVIRADAPNDALAVRYNPF